MIALEMWFSRQISELALFVLTLIPVSLIKLSFYFIFLFLLINTKTHVDHVREY